ncbi:MAG: asparaginase [bacterium]
MQPGPVLAVETRSGRVQAVHTGHAILLGRDGHVVRSWGTPEQPTYWRSAAKPFQALPFVASGAMASFDIGDAELAVACGSHAAEPMHVEAALHTLTAAGLQVADLKCGVHDPGALAGPMPAGGWTAIHNNCSGKHAAMVATCKHRGWPVDGYLEASHPLQVEIRGWVARAAGLDAADVPFGVDGCSLPTFFLPVASLARSFQWLQRSGEAPALRVLEAMANRPEMVGGTGNSDTDLPRLTEGHLVSKYGALGVVGAVDRRTGEAIAVKLDAGTSQPARAVALAVMAEAGWLTEAQEASLAPHIRPTLRNHAGLEVGHVEPQLAGSLDE